MITCKEDLIGTYVKNDNGELLGAYIAKCLSLGFRLSPALYNGKIMDDNLTYAAVGIDGDCVWAVSSHYDVMKNQLTLEDLKPQTKEAEWVNGDECTLSCGDKYFFIGMLMKSNQIAGDCLIQHEGGAPIVEYYANLKKPETPEQKLERNELEAAYDLYCEFTNENSVDATCMSSFSFKQSLVKIKWLAIVRKTNYKVKGE